MRFAVFLGILAALVGAAILAGRLFSSEKDRLRDRLDACVLAIEKEDADALGGMLSSSFRFGGEGAVGSGDRERALERVRRLAEDSRSLRIRIGKVDADFEGNRADVRVETYASYGTFQRRTAHERFDGTMAPLAVNLELRKDPGGAWILESARIATRDPFSEARRPGGRR